MKLNIDCMIDIILLVEKEIVWDNKIKYPKHLNLFKEQHNIKDYSPAEILYHIEQCYNFGFINCYTEQSDIVISDLTPRGHWLLMNYRQDNTLLKNLIYSI